MTEENRLLLIEDTPQKSQWDALQATCPSLSNWGLNTLKTGLDGHVGTIVVEPRYICKDHRNLHSNFYSKKFKERSATCTRVHFFSSTGITRGRLIFDLDALQPYYIGYAVVRPFSERCLGRTVIDPYLVGRHKKDGFYVLRTGFKTHLGGPALTAHGYPYMSQDGEATVCAHTALWGLCRFLSERYSAYREVYPYDLISMTTDTQGRPVPYHGMTYSDYSQILVGFGCHPEILPIKLRDTDPAPDAGRFQQLCTYTESGFPVIASFAGHVVSIVGHTLDRARAPQPDIDGLVDSSAYFKQLIVVDDNFFPYQLLGDLGDPMNYGKAYKNNPYHLGSIRVAVCPLPEKVYLPASKARTMFTDALKAFLGNSELALLLRDGLGEPLVTRMLIATSSSFKSRKLAKAFQGNQMTDPFAVKVADLHLPHFVWLMEIAPRSHYLNGLCTGEIVLDATANSMEEALLYARIGPRFLLNKNQLSVSNPSVCLKTFVQYTHNLGEL